MWIRLMSDVPDEAIFGEVKNRMQSQRKFDDAHIRSKMDAAGFDQTAKLVANLLRQRFQLSD